MILTESQIKEIILDNPNKDMVERGRKYNKKMRLHLYGIGLDKALERIDGYEPESLHALKVKYARSNKDLFSRLGRPMDKVFTARGGSVYYNLPDTLDKKARSLALDVRNGLSVRKWIETVWKPHMLDDPFGFLFLEILPTNEAAAAKAQGRSFVYPTYKSINSVYDYLPKGSGLEYVVFKVEDKEKRKAGIDIKWEVYRVVDDAFDYYVRKEADAVSVLPGHVIPNYFGSVPALVNSDITDPSKDGCFLSFYDDAIELADHFLLKGAIKLTHEFLHGFPKYWEYADDCSDCGGTRNQNGEPCTSCKGTGKKLMLKVSDAKLLNYPDSKETPIVAPNVAGYVSPDKTYWEIATQDLSMLEDIIHVTIWGTQAKGKTAGMSVDQQGGTATEAMLDIKPEADRLAVVSDMAEKRHKFILDNIIRVQVAQNYPGSAVSYGRRYMIESPDAIWEKYSKARTAGAPLSVLDDLLIEFYEAKYQSDEVALAIALKLMYVEPFVHMSAQQLKGLMPAEEDWKAKLYFSEWLALQSDAAILSGDVVDLKASLADYVSTKQLTPEPAPTPFN